MLIKYTGKYVNIYFIMKITCSVDLRYEECVNCLRRRYWRVRNIVHRLLQDLRTGVKFLVKSWNYLSLLLRRVTILT